MEKARQAEKDVDVGSSVLRWNYFLMTTLGVWPTRPNKFRFYLSFIYMSYCIILEYIDLCLIIDNLELVVMNFTENMAFTQIIFRMYVLHSSRRDFGELIKEAKRDINAKDYTEDERKIFTPYHKKSKSILKLLIVNTAMTATSFYLKPFLGQIHEIIEYAGSHGQNATFIFLLPYRFYNFYELKDASTYFWTYFSQLPFVFVSGFGQCASDCVMITMIYHVSGQMAVLANRISNLSANPSQSTEEIKKLIESHLRLLRMGHIIRETFKSILLLNLVCATILLCMLGYQILMCLANGETAILLSFFVYMSLVLLILYTICRAGENLLIESNRICEAYYNCNWYKMSKENIRTITFCILRSQKPLRITAGKFNTFCLQTFTDTLKAAMGYLSVLIAVM